MASASPPQPPVLPDPGGDGRPQPVSPPPHRRHAAPPLPRRRLARAAFYAHLWIGVVFTIALLVIAVTGILLNHKRGLGLMPEVDHTPTRPFGESVSLAALAAAALRAAAPDGEVPRGEEYIDRMDVRPRDGIVKVRLRDAASTEVTLALADGRVLHMGRRGDVFLEKLHSGEAFGSGWVLLSDAAAIALVITLITGYWLWLAPKLRRAGARAGERAAGGTRGGAGTAEDQSGDEP